MRQRLRSAAEAFRDLYESLGRTPVRDLEENPAILFDRAAEKVCRDCALCSLCWRKEYVGTFNAMNDAAPFLLERGRALAKDFPSYFADRCIHLTDYLSAVNGELSAYLLRRQYRLRLEESRRERPGPVRPDEGAPFRRGGGSDGGAAGLRQQRRPDVPGGGRPPAQGGGEGLRRQPGELRRPRGQLCLLLLGRHAAAGRAARRESALTSRLLRQFLEAGIQPEAALKTLNSAMALRGEETGSFATIDLLTLPAGDRGSGLLQVRRGPQLLKAPGLRPAHHRHGPCRRDCGTAPAPPDVTRLPAGGREALPS